MTQNTGAFVRVNIYQLVTASYVPFTVLLHLFNQMIRGLVQEEVWQQRVTWRSFTYMMSTTRHRVGELSGSTFLDSVWIKVSDSFLLQDVFIHQEPACVVLRLRQDCIGGVCHDVCCATLFSNAIAAQHVHRCCLDCYGNRTKGGGMSKLHCLCQTCKIT